MGKTYKSYDPEILKKLQNTQLTILEDFIKVCSKYNLDYFMLGGSGIGAIRHHGFIPWDDDIDVAMTREHYDIFLRVMSEEIGDKYKLLTPLIDKRYACNVTKLQKRGTKFVPELSKNLKCDLCIDIDIFPMDNIPDDLKLRKAQLRNTWILSKLLYLRGTGSPIIPLTGMKKKIATILCHLIHMVLVLFRVSPRWIYKQLQKEQKKYNNIECQYKCPLEVTMAKRAYISQDEMYPLIKVPFENLEVNMPHEYDTYLRRLFGDYMTMPPVEKRVNHCPYILDFGE